MNIALVVYSHYSRDARVRRYAESLARSGHTVDVICLKEDYQPKQANIHLLMYPIPRRRFGRVWYGIEYLLFFTFSLVTLTFNYFRERYRVIHINNMPDFLVFSAFIPKMFGAKIILDMHDPMPELYMAKYQAGNNDPAVKILKLLESLSFRFANQILTANEEFRKMFLSRNPGINSKISVILNCPDPRIFLDEVGPRTRSDLPKNTHFTLMYMGTVEKRFGLDIAIAAMPKLIKKIPRLQFVIIPKLEEEGNYIKNIKYQISNIKLEKYIKILKPLPLEEIAKKLKEADVGVVLAKNGIFTESIFPVKLLEFVQTGVPVIATKTKILSRYFGGNQIYFLPKNNPDEFAKAVLTLYRNKALRKTLAKNAKSYLKKYNWMKEERKYIALLRREIRRIPA